MILLILEGRFVKNLYICEKHVKLLVTSTSPYIIFISTVRIDLPMFHE